MQNPDKLFGRLSNRMFQMAAFLAYCWDNNYHFFVQDEKYFKKYEAQIRQLYGEGIDQRNKGYVGIHVRRAKNPINPEEPAYSENPFYNNLMHHQHEDMSDNYYVKAMAMFPNYKFKIFSDDPWWCKEQKIFKDCEFADECNKCVKSINPSGNVVIQCSNGGWYNHQKTDVEDMNEMASCEHNIIANSSFSWWAAWLNPNPDKIVVAPAKWFSNPEDEKFIGIPPEWIRI